MLRDPGTGNEFGTAEQVADQLGPDVTAAHVRDWRRRGLLVGVHVPGRGRGTTVYALDDALEVELAMRTSTRGRKRLLDIVITMA